MPGMMQFLVGIKNVSWKTLDLTSMGLPYIHRGETIIASTSYIGFDDETALGNVVSSIETTAEASGVAIVTQLSGPIMPGLYGIELPEYYQRLADRPLPAYFNFKRWTYISPEYDGRPLNRYGKNPMLRDDVFSSDMALFFR